MICQKNVFIWKIVVLNNCEIYRLGICLLDFISGFYIIWIFLKIKKYSGIIKHIYINLLFSGHSVSDIVKAETAFCNGASFITHLFNAMLPFHHRDPGIVGLLTSHRIPKPAFYGLICDGIHTHPTSLRIAYRSHPKGLTFDVLIIMKLFWIIIMVWCAFVGEKLETKD